MLGCSSHTAAALHWSLSVTEKLWQRVIDEISQCVESKKHLLSDTNFESSKNSQKSSRAVRDLLSSAPRRYVVDQLRRTPTDLFCAGYRFTLLQVSCLLIFFTSGNWSLRNTLEERLSHMMKDKSVYRSANLHSTATFLRPESSEPGTPGHYTITLQLNEWLRWDRSRIYMYQLYPCEWFSCVNNKILNIYVFWNFKTLLDIQCSMF